ncbi:DUF441 domain-containing protein [Desulfofundulus thermocisternus]|uniref:DUF441 domain-containing protein n=1 Tax=Desulfofundulus thermocisternus TaxID=42471 RepID=UPI0019DDE105|nr:DUF441 domain-containing protein [Desulfofundulus thermocisternus]MBE3586937.1 DUF441 domain-containing protein [Thermoanaerobacter sp.]MCS5695629.1 DUF441 domain-containing protein [Desulfofundulus thermocisternus]
MEPTLIILAILVVAVLGRANSVAVAAGILLLIKLLQADKYLFPAIEKGGVFWGLVLLTASILVPLARGDITCRDLGRVFVSWVGLLAFVFSLLTTYLSGQGLQYLTMQGHGDVMPALILGAVMAAAFLGGVPVGPLITSGLLALTVKLIARG